MDLWRLSLLNVFAAPVRSALTVLGMAIGVGAILAVITLGDAGKMQVKSEMARLGIDKVWITAVEGEQLTQSDAALLSDVLHAETAGTVYASAEAACGEEMETIMVVGCETDYLEMTGVEIISGRRLHPLEWEADGRSLLLGEGAAQTLHAFVGDTVYVFDKPYLVCGIIRGTDGFAKVNPETAVFLPLQTLRSFLGETVHEIMLSVPKDTTPQAAAAMAQNVLWNQRGATVDALTLQVQMEAADSVVEVFVEVLKWVAAVCVLVGGIGVMNILLVSVRERRREIGIMKSLGTTHGQICTMFLMEALSYAAIGGLLGIALGKGLILIAGTSIGLSAQAGTVECMAVFAAAMFIGIFFGVSPASKAAGLTCVDALKEE